MTKTISWQLARKVLFGSCDYSNSKLGSYNLEYDHLPPDDVFSYDLKHLYVYEREILCVHYKRKSTTYINEFRDAEIHWTMAGRNTQVTRDRLSAFGIILKTKRGRVYWHKPDGTVQEIGLNNWYSIPASNAIIHIMQNIGYRPWGINSLLPNQNCVSQEIREPLAL